MLAIMCREDDGVRGYIDSCCSETHRSSTRDQDPEVVVHSLEGGHLDHNMQVFENKNLSVDYAHNAYDK